MSGHRYRVTWPQPEGLLVCAEPSVEELARHAGTLAGWYNDEHNRELMSNSATLTAADVVDLYGEMRERGGRPFLLFLGDVLMGDADLRRLQGVSAEFAIMVGARAAQGRGWGTRFSVMVHALAFGVLGRRTVHLSIVPHNVGGRRCYEKVGYVEDAGPGARACCDLPTDVGMSLTRERFLELHGAAAASVRVETVPSLAEKGTV